MRNKEIQKGDRMFARLTMGGKLIVEFMINTVANMEELLMELRRMIGNLRGLGRLQVRNQSRGWMSVSNLMFYGQIAETSNSFNGNNLLQPKIEVANQTMPKVAKVVAPHREPMFFPWETH